MKSILTVLEKQTTIPRAAPLPWTTKTTDDEDSFLSTEKETHADGGKFGLAVGRPDSQFPNLNFDRFPWCRKLKTPQAPTNGCFAGAADDRTKTETTTTTASSRRRRAICAWRRSRLRSNPLAEIHTAIRTALQSTRSRRHFHSRHSKHGDKLVVVDFSRAE
ncbi:unnamed protein product [Ixodes persulcatus]